jgi:hypothetical protein
MRQRHARARKHAKDAAAYDYAIASGRPLVELVKLATWNTPIWRAEDQGVTTFDRAGDTPRTLGLCRSADNA